jgi:hypothetical protein
MNMEQLVEWGGGEVVLFLICNNYNFTETTRRISTTGSDWGGTRAGGDELPGLWQDAEIVADCQNCLKEALRM